MKTNLCIVYNDGTTDTDYSFEAQNFKRDTFTVTLETDDFIYVGYPKSISAVYVHMTQFNTLGGTLTAEYSNDQGTWSPLEICDDTRNFARNGFITWDRQSDAGEVTVDSQAKCWVRFSTDTLQSEVIFQAINIIFSDDNALCEFEPALIDACFYRQGQTSHILSHVAAKSAIMSKLQNLGYIKYDSDGNQQSINEWDILNVHQLKLASTYYAIAQIYFNLSDDPEDQYWAKYREYQKKFDEAFALGRLDIDIDDDGIVDEVEKRAIRSRRWVR